MCELNMQPFPLRCRNNYICTLHQILGLYSLEQAENINLKIQRWHIFADLTIYQLCYRLQVLQNAFIIMEYIPKKDILFTVYTTFLGYADRDALSARLLADTGGFLVCGRLRTVIDRFLFSLHASCTQHKVHATPWDSQCLTVLWHS